MTDIQKAAIVSLLNAGQKQVQIAHQLDIPPSTISDFINRYQKCGSIANARRSGRPRKTTKAEDLFIVNTALAHTHIPLAELHIDTNSRLSDISIHRRLLEVGIRKWRAADCAKLTQKHAEERLKWARDHSLWRVDDWRKIVFSDEVSVEKDKDPNSVWVFDTEIDTKNISLKTLIPERRIAAYH